MTNLDNKSVEQLGNAIMNWIKVVKNVMDAAIPKSTYRFTYQLKTTPEIRNLETQFKNLKGFVQFVGWTLQTYREYSRIKPNYVNYVKKSTIKTGRIKLIIYQRTLKIVSNSGIKSNN